MWPRCVHFNPLCESTRHTEEMHFHLWHFKGTSSAGFSLPLTKTSTQQGARLFDKPKGNMHLKWATAIYTQPSACVCVCVCAATMKALVLFASLRTKSASWRKAGVICREWEAEGSSAPSGVNCLSVVTLYHAPNLTKQNYLGSTVSFFSLREKLLQSLELRMIF